MNVGIFKIQENVVDLILSIILEGKIRQYQPWKKNVQMRACSDCYFLNKRHLQV